MKPYLQMTTETDRLVQKAAEAVELDVRKLHTDLYSVFNSRFSVFNIGPEMILRWWPDEDAWRVHVLGCANKRLRWKSIYRGASPEKALVKAKEWLTNK